MFNKKNENFNSAKTIIGKDVTIDANSFTGTGTIRIDGRIRGEIKIDGSLIIGESGIVEGNISANQLLVAGKVVGDITCDGEVHFTPTANMTGNVYYITLVTDDGASINGFCRNLNSNSSKPEKIQAVPIEAEQEEAEQTEQKEQVVTTEG